MSLTSFQRARRLASEAKGAEAAETTYDDATNVYLGADKDAGSATKAKRKAKPDLADDYDLRRPASIGEGDGDNNKSLSPADEADYRGLTYSMGQPGDNQKNDPANIASLETDAPLKTVDETQVLLKSPKKSSSSSKAKQKTEEEG